MKLYQKLLLVLIIFSASAANAQGYKIKFNVKNLNDSVVYLARYFGDNKYIKDTIVINGVEKFTIEGDEALPCGIYLIVRERRNTYFEFLVSENQSFTMITDTSDFINKTSFKGSPENEQMYDYFKFSASKGKIFSDTSATVEQKQAVANEIEAYKEAFILRNPTNPMTVVFGMQKEVEIPESLKNKKGDAADKEKYYYYLNHYWDNVDFASTCILRTPVFHGKLQRYFDKWVPQHYDSIARYADMVVEKARVNEEAFKYVVNYLTFKWESGKEKRMCWDKVFYHMASTYYLSSPSQTPWVEEGKMAKIKTRVDDSKYCLCGEPAVPMQMKYKNYGFPSGMPDTNQVYHDFNKMKQDYIVLWFWDSDCGHCKKQTPKLHDVYDKYKKEGRSVEVYAINIEQESAPYIKYLREHDYGWINVQDTAHLTNFREYYDIYSTPVAYVLDKDRKIIGKRLDPAGIDNFLGQLFEEADKKRLEGTKE